MVDRWRVALQACGDGVRVAGDPWKREKWRGERRQRYSYAATGVLRAARCIAAAARRARVRAPPRGPATTRQALLGDAASSRCCTGVTVPGGWPGRLARRAPARLPAPHCGHLPPTRPHCPPRPPSRSFCSTAPTPVRPPPPAALCVLQPTVRSEGPHPT
jgi:hypothetical protein